MILTGPMIQDQHANICMRLLGIYGRIYPFRDTSHQMHLVFVIEANVTFAWEFDVFVLFVRIERIAVFVLKRSESDGSVLIVRFEVTVFVYEG